MKPNFQFIFSATYVVIFTNKIVIQKLNGKSYTQNDKLTCLEMYLEEFG
jgi:hypothetical protein